jgi:hypothetical protein
LTEVQIELIQINKKYIGYKNIKNKIEDYNNGKKVYFHYEDFENYKDLFIENIVLKSDKLKEIESKYE